MSLYQKASLVQIPSGYKASAAKLYSVVPNSGDGDFTVSVPATSTRVNKDGLVESVAANQARLSYDPSNPQDPHLLLEPTRTNLQVYSEQFDNAAWTKSNCSVSANQTTSPDGATTADKIIENSGTGSKKVYDSITTSIGTAYTWSVFLKADTRSKVRLNIFGAYAEFDVTNQTLLTQSGITSYKIEDYGNGWGRFSITETANASSTLTYVYLLDDAGNVSYTGDGASGLFAFGAQLEAGSYATSYIPTSGSAATRTVDYASGAGDVNTFNDSEGTLFIEAAALGNDNTYRVINISDGTTSNRVLIQLGNSNNQIRADLIVGGTTQSSFSTTSYDFTNYNKIAIRYKLNDVAMFVNGTQVGTTDTSANVFSSGTLDRIDFQNGSLGSTFYFRGKLKQLMYFDTGLTNTELQTLTS